MLKITQIYQEHIFLFFVYWKYLEKTGEQNFGYDIIQENWRWKGVVTMLDNFI